MNKCKGCPLTPDICHGGKEDCRIGENEMDKWIPTTKRLPELDADTAITILVNAEYADEFQGLAVVQEAQHLAIDALKKQIPKKLAELSAINKDSIHSTYSCPSCGGLLLVTNYQLWSRKPKFCPGCGQAIDWGDEDA